MIKRVSLVLIAVFVLGLTTSVSLAAPVNQATSGNDADSHLSSALDAARAEDWATVEQELNEAADLSTDAQQQAAIAELLDDLSNKKYDEIVSDLTSMVETSGTVSPVQERFQTALNAAKDEDWATVEQELNEAADLSTDAQEQAAIAELLDDLSNKKYDEIVSDLTSMVETSTAMSPVQERFQTALNAAKDEDWATVKQELNEAADLSTDAQQQASISELLDDLANQKYDEIVSDLTSLIEKG